MTKQLEKTKYYRAILNVLDVVETLPRSMKRALKENEYKQALAVLDYNLLDSSLKNETGLKLIEVAKSTEKRQCIREIVDILVKTGKFLTVEQILEKAGE